MTQNQPSWLDDAVFYEIYPQSFMDTNADGIGDFSGIISKLDYIKDLGCNAIWLNPCFKSPFGDAGYDVSDYYTAAPRYGTNEDLKRLFKEVHRRGMHIISELLPSHIPRECHELRRALQQIKVHRVEGYHVADEGRINARALDVVDEDKALQHVIFIEEFFVGVFAALHVAFALVDARR